MPTTKYASSSPCRKYKKSVSPKCNDQSECEWKVGSGCMARVKSGRPLSSAVAARPSRRSETAKIYATHDNGARPYKVEVLDGGSKVNVYSNGWERKKMEDGSLYDMDRDDIEFQNSKLNSQDKLVISYNDVKKVHVPEHKEKHMPAEFGRGNTILLELGDQQTCVVIGDAIKEFPIKDKVIEYFSEIGNNDVPYPVLLGSENVYFLLHDNAFVPRSKFPAKQDWKSAYTIFYDKMKDISKPINGLIYRGFGNRKEEYKRAGIVLGKPIRT